MNRNGSRVLWVKSPLSRALGLQGESSQIHADPVFGPYAIAVLMTDSAYVYEQIPCLRASVHMVGNDRMRMNGRTTRVYACRSPEASSSHRR